MPTPDDHDRGMINVAFEQTGAICGLWRADLQRVIRANGHLDCSASLQFVELIGHLTTLVGSEPEVQSNWLRAINLDLGDAPLAVMSKPGGIEQVRDYLAGHRHRC